MRIPLIGLPPSGATGRVISVPAPAQVLGLAMLAAAVAGAAAASCRPALSMAPVQGVVREAAGGDTVCVQTSPDHRRLTRIRLLDVEAPPLRGPGGEGAKWALRRVARGKAVACRMRAWGAGVCAIDGQPIGALLRAKGRR
jgi:endonuclease YncB( thermonuclease family)